MKIWKPNHYEVVRKDYIYFVKLSNANDDDDDDDDERFTFGLRTSH